MLYALSFANTFEEFPTGTELARAYDGRDRIPRPTLRSRRGMVRAMVHAGLIAVHHEDDKGRNHYQITEAGMRELRPHLGSLKP